MKGEYPAGAAAKFVLLSAAGVILFFVPAWGGVIPVVRLIDSIKAVFTKLKRTNLHLSI